MKWLVYVMLLFVSACTSSEIEDPAIPIVKYSEEFRDKNRERVNSLKGEDKDCVNNFVKSYQESLLEYCELTNGGENIGGGCAHVAYAWSIHTEVLVRALNQCKTST